MKHYNYIITNKKYLYDIIDKYWNWYWFIWFTYKELFNISSFWIFNWRCAIMLKLIFKHAPVVSQAFGFTKVTIW